MTPDDPREAWEATRRRAAAILAKHLPPPQPGDREDNEVAAKVIFNATSYAAGQYIVGNADEERAKLGDLIRCARELSRIYASLDPRVRTALWLGAYLMDPREAGMPADRRIDLMDLNSLPVALARVLPRGFKHLKTIDQPPSSGPGGILVGHRMVLPPTLVRGLRKFSGWLTLVGEGPRGQVSQG